MGLNGILSSALTSLQSNTSAMRVVSQNISNLNTANYARRVVNFESLGAAGMPVGVTIEDVQRVSDQYLNQEAYSATSSSSQYNSLSGVFDKINAYLGSPGDGNALTTKLNDIFTQLGAAALSTSTSSSQAGVVNSMKSLASSISSMSSSLDGLQNQVDSQLSTSVTEANTLIKQVYDYNQLIRSSTMRGDSDNTYLDQRETALSSLAEQMDIKVTPQDDGTVQVTTQDGLNLVSDSYAKLSYTTGENGNYSTISAQDTNGSTGLPISSAQVLDSHLSGGTMRGLIDARDSTITGLKNELGAFAQTVAQSFNAVHNANSAYPAPTTMNGRNTGLLSSDSLNFTGQSQISLTNSSGQVDHSVQIDFDSGTISVDGSTAASFSDNIGDFANQLDSALSSVGASASFSDGKLSLDGGSDGLVIADPDSTTPSSRAGTGFSQFFGLNDLFTTSIPNIQKTGMSSSDTLGLSADGDISLSLKDSSGDVASSVKVAITSSMTVDDAITAINSALNGRATLTFNSSDGSVTTAVASKYAGYQLQVTGDTTSRGNTGVDISQLFGIGANTIGSMATNFQLNSDIASDSSRIALGKATGTSGQIIGAGNSDGLAALQGLASSKQSFAKAGNLNAQSSSLTDYASALYQDIATQSSSASASKTTEADRLTEAQTRVSNNSGVNLDEELSNLIIYQRAYSASARLMNTVSDLYDTLLSIK